MDKAKKKQLKKIITWVSLALVVAFLAAMPLIARQEAEADGPVASVLSGEVTRGSIASTIHGGGNIEAENVEDVILPTGVKIEGFLVKNGQFVKAGDPLAQVDKVSAMTAIMEVNETLEFLQDELEAARDEKIPANVTATGGGRVKKVFARPGEAVQDVMLRDGALAIVSLDGLMAVKLEKNLALTTGETVTVALAGGEEVSGRVESNLDGVVIITVEDEGYEAGQTVTVTDESGHRLGQAQLYIHNAWKATAYSGTVESVSAREEQTLTEGATILTLTDRDYEGELRRRANQHREYEALLQDLFRMYQTGYLYAPCDGEVEGVDNDSVHLLNATPEGWVLAPLNNTSRGEEKGWTVMLLTSTTSTGCNLGCNLTWEQHFTENRDPSSCPAICQHCKANLNVTSNVHGDSCITFCTGEYNCDALTHEPTCGTYCTQASTIGKCALSSYTGAKHHPNCIHSCTYGNNSGTHCAGTLHHALGCIESCKEADGVTNQCDATGDHKITCVKSCIEADSLNVCPADPNHSANCLERCSNSATCSSNKHINTCPHYNLIYTARVGLVVRVAEGVIEYTYESSQEVSAIKMGSSFTVAQVPNSKTMVNGPDFVASGGVSCKAGDIILIVYGRDENAELQMTQVVVHSQSGAGNMMGGMSGMSGMAGGMKGFSGMTGGMSGFGYSYTIEEEDEGLFDLDGSTLLTVTEHNKAKLVISIDEHDIAKLSTGMKATVKLAALKGEEFKAEITTIAVSGTNNGGSSKFDVTLTLPMSENMLSGMSASAVIELEDKQDILLIPAAALVQQGAKTVVYTSLDKRGEPSNPVEVKTGLSDGENVEILSGLEEGQTFYYSYYDTVELDNSAEASKYTFR